MTGHSEQDRTDWRRRRSGPTQLASLAVAMGLVAASCGGDGDASDNNEDVAGDTAVTQEVAADDAVTEAEEETADDDGSDDSGSDDGVAEDESMAEPDLTGLRVVTTNALGGLRLGVDPAVQVVHEGELIQIRHPSAAGEVIVARTTVSNSGADIATVEDFLEEAATVASAQSEATGDSITLLGMELEEYEVRGELPPGPPALFASSLPGLASNMNWIPLPIADLYLAEVGGGVLVAGVVATDEADLPALHELLEDVLPTVSLTGPELLSLPTPAVTSFVPFGEPTPVTPREVENGLIQPFSLAEPGSYDLANLSQSMSIEIGDGWFVAPNFPGFVVLADVMSGRAAGPGDHDLLFLQGVTGIHPIGALRGDIAPSLPLQTEADLEAFLADPPPGLLVSNLEPEASLGGTTVVKFDLEVDPDATCQPEFPCVFVMSPAITDFVRFIESGYSNRFWWLPDAPGGGLLIAAAAPAASSDWFDGRAAELVESITFN